MADEITEAQMRTRLLVIDCARGGHAPASVVRELGSVVAVAAYCECCEVRWLPALSADARVITEDELSQLLGEAHTSGYESGSATNG